MGKIIYSALHRDLILDTDSVSAEIEVQENGCILIILDENYIYIDPEEAVDLATKIINHCYPFTIKQSLRDRQKQSESRDSDSRPERKTDAG